MKDATVEDECQLSRNFAGIRVKRDCICRHQISSSAGKKAKVQRDSLESKVRYVNRSSPQVHEIGVGLKKFSAANGRWSVLDIVRGAMFCTCRECAENLQLIPIPI